MLPAAERSESNKVPSEARLIGFRHIQCNQLTKQPQCPSGGPVITLTSRPEGPSLMGWMGWTDGPSKGSFNFFHTLLFCRLGIYLLIHKIKIVTNILMGFKFLCQVEDFDHFFKITLCTCVFEKSCYRRPSEARLIKCRAKRG